MVESRHVPVLLDEVLRGLNVRSDGIYVDCTYGRGGHSDAILARLGETGKLLVFDRDPSARGHAIARYAGDSRVACVHASFTRLEQEVSARGWTGKVHGILFDLGVSSPQLDEGDRGFSFLRDGELDMRFDPAQGLSAAEWLNQAEESEIVDVLRRYGEERYARRIAAAIVTTRSSTPLHRTHELRDLIRAAVPSRERDKDPATRSFQALRILINDEIGALEEALPQAIRVLAPGGRLAVISFHSLEDRVVKRRLREDAVGDPFPPDLPVTADQLHPVVRLIGRPVRPEQAEIDANPRSRSAILRVAEKLAA